MNLETLLANISCYVGDAIIVTDTAWQEGGPHILYVNEGFTRLTGYESEDVMGKSPRLMHGPDTDSSLTARIQRSLEKGQSITIEQLHYTKKKHRFWVEANISPVLNDAGECIYYLAIEKDITDRKVMQEATEQQRMQFLFSETRSRAIMNSIVDAIITVNSEGIIERFSPSAERLFGCEASDREGMPVFSLFVAPGDSELQAILAAKMLNQHDTGNLSTHSLMAKRGNGEEFAAEITCSVMQLGQEKLMVCAVRDVTQIRRAVEEMRHARDVAEAASRAKSEFLANMSHELRTPMNGILGLSAIIKETVLDLEQRECVEALSGSAASLLTILNDILDFSKIEAGEMKLVAQTFSIHDMLHHVRDFMAPLASQKGLSLEFMQAEDAREYLLGDVHRIQQILLNLVGNAIKFTEKGYVHVRSSGAREGDEIMLRIEVQDSGIGISEEQCQRIFQKFTQADGSDTRRYGGTGLGLAISQQLVSLMGGEMGVDSTPGVGSCFWITLRLPLVESCVWQPREEDFAPAVISENEAGNARVLIVEDHAINHMLLSKLLTKMGFHHIDRVEHGGQAVQACYRAQYDLILMDCQMPIMDGYEATRRIRMQELHQGRRTPIVAMTANAMQGDQEKCLDAGMDDYLSKPIDLVMLKRVLTRWLQVTPAMTPDMHEAAGINPHLPVDMHHLRMFTDGNLAEEKTLFGIFMSNADETVSRLQESLHKQDSESWRKAAHRLKGASGNLGAGTLSDLCAQAEKASGFNAEIWSGYMQAIDAELNRVRSFIHQQGGCD